MEIKLQSIRVRDLVAGYENDADKGVWGYDWATEMRNQKECVVSGFCSKLEQDVLHFLLKGNQPIIRVYSEAQTMEEADALGKRLMQVVYDMQ